MMMKVIVSKDDDGGNCSPFCLFQMANLVMLMSSMMAAKMPMILTTTLMIIISVNLGLLAEPGLLVVAGRDHSS